MVWWEEYTFVGVAWWDGVFGGSGLMRGLDISGSGLMRGVVFGGSGLIKGGLLYDINPVSSF
jgi:hypothetical protein